MGQRPISIRIKMRSGDGASDDYILLSVGEVAHRLGISERTVFRRIRSGELERADPSPAATDLAVRNSLMTDIKTDIKPNLRVLSNDYVRLMTDNDRHKPRDDSGEDREETQSLRSQLREKDIQIAQLMCTQGQLNETIQRLQDQLYEMSHLILSHHIEMEQSRLRADLERTRIEGKKSRLGKLFDKL